MTIPSDLNILYLVHDLSDATVAKRVKMLKDGGATVAIAGFRRSSEPIHTIHGCNALDFGQTFNAGFMQRILSVLKIIITIGKYRASFHNADIIIARNLEMLAIAVRGRILKSPAAPTVYESLDIHRLLLGNGTLNRALRSLEGWLTKRVSLLLTSSPAFITCYFKALSNVNLPTLLLENKIYGLNDADTSDIKREIKTPWKIGWFGAIRCRKSLDLLCNLVRENNGAIEVIIRGRPALDQFDDFHSLVTHTPGLQFLGPYKNPDDLQAIYQEVHFTWAIDMFEEGLNSTWLLPNRLYEGGFYNSVPIAQANVETGEFLKRLGIGVLLSEPKDQSLRTFFHQLTASSYQQLATAVQEVPKSTWVYGKEDCMDLVSRLRNLKSGQNGQL